MGLANGSMVLEKEQYLDACFSYDGTKVFFIQRVSAATTYESLGLVAVALDLKIGKITTLRTLTSPPWLSQIAYDYFRRQRIRIQQAHPHSTPTKHNRVKSCQGDR